MTPISQAKPPVFYTEVNSDKVDNSAHKIVIASSSHRILNISRLALECSKEKGAVDFENPCFYATSKDSRVKPIQLLTLPFDNLTSSKLEAFSEFQSQALNVILIHPSDSEIPSVLLETMQKIESVKTVIIFESKMIAINIHKHLFKISKYVKNLIPYIKGVTFEDDPTKSVLGTLIQNSGNLKSISFKREARESMFWFDKEKSKVFPHVTNYSCNTQELVKDINRKEYKEYYEKYYLYEYEKNSNEIKKLKDKLSMVLGEIDSNFSIEERCTMVIAETEKSIYEETKLSKQSYFDKCLKKLDVFNEQLSSLEKPLGKRSRNDFGSSFNLPNARKSLTETLASAVTEKDRETSREVFKGAILKKSTELQKKITFLEKKIVRLLGAEYTDYDAKEWCAIKAQKTEEKIFEASNGSLENYIDLCSHQKIPYRTFTDEFFLPGEKSREFFGPKFTYPENSVSQSLGLESPWYYSAPYNNLSRLLFSYKNRPLICGGPQQLEYIYRSDERNKEIAYNLPMFPGPVGLNLGECTISYGGNKYKGLQKMTFFHGNQLEKPSYWTDYQEGFLEEVALDLNSDECQFWADEIKKIHPEAILTKVTQIQNFQHLNNFDLKACVMHAYSTGSSFVANGKKEVSIAHEEDKLFYYGSRETQPSEIIRSIHGVPLAYTGFDPNNNWGTGIHLSESIQYADKNSYTTIDCEKNEYIKELLIVQANLGFSVETKPDPTLKRPPLRGYLNNQCVYYDSVHGKYDSKNIKANVHTVFASDQVLPLFLLQYRISCNEIS